MAIATSVSPASTLRTVGSRCASPSSSTRRRSSQASGSTARSRLGATSATRRAPMQPIALRASATNLHRSTGSIIMAHSTLQAVPSAQDKAGEAPVTSVDLRCEFEAVDIASILAQLDRELIGLVPVKTRIREIASLLLVERIRHKMSLANTYPTLHMSFTGNPGTGKTTVALRMADLLHRLGFVRRGHLVSVTRDDLVGQYIGHTAPKTKEILKKAMGGVLFIDEAYYLYRPENERDYGQESIEILLQVMENQRDDIVVILAGYKNRMDTFFRSNPGMASRSAHHIDFPDYTPDELLQIAELIAARMDYRFDEASVVAMREYITHRITQPNFANARSIRNALDRARL